MKVDPQRVPDTCALGHSAEDVAADLLRHEGYWIVERTYRCKLGELDIVAGDGAVLAFVEVRSRADDEHGHAAEMITRAKQRRVSRVAACYLAERRPSDTQMRFDVVAITGDDVQLIKDAWRL